MDQPCFAKLDVDVYVGGEGNVDMGECYDLWTQFMKALLNDISLLEEMGWIFMPDKQKVILAYYIDIT